MLPNPLEWVRPFCSWVHLDLSGIGLILILGVFGIGPMS